MRAMLEAELDRLIPADESRPLAGKTFIEWEQQADELDRGMTAAFLEERAALDKAAAVSSGHCGVCPGCGSDRVYLVKPRGPTERQTTHGKVVLSEQRCRCRSCGRHFSPSA
jgi:hypothetical protein